MNEVKELKVVDTWVNLNTPEFSGVFRVGIYEEVSKFFRHMEYMQKGVSVEDMIKELDDAGIDKVLLTAYGVDHPEYPDVRCVLPEDVAKVVEEYPERFIMAAGFNSERAIKANRKGITEAVKRLEMLVTDYNLRCFRIVPFVFNLPANDRIFYPFYCKCEELGIPVSINVGVPGPPGPLDPQHPKYLDSICLDFPNLTIIGSHGGHPWERLLIRLMMKYPNLYLMTSGYSPRHIVPEMLSFMNSTRGNEKVMFGSGWPLLMFDRAVKEARALPLKEENLKNYLRNNALRVFKWE